MPLLPGEGYTMKGSSGAVNIGSQQNYVFKGKPYNGDFTLPITAGGDRLIGNPYSSAMDANEFILDNIKETINGMVGRNAKNIFNGALYFWDHFGERNSHYLKEYVGGYATYTLMGGTKAIANDARINTTSGILSSKEPQQYIPVGQGFFVIAELDILTDSTTTTVEGGNIVFKNSQRVFVRESGDTSVFMKAAKSKISGKETAENKVDSDSRPKIWLQFDSPTGYHRQLLVGVDENTSNNFDLGYDAPIAGVGKEDMYWTFSGSKFVIQAVNNFNNQQELPLGLKVSKTGLVRIKIDKTENLNKNLLLYIKDKLTNETFEITEKPFEMMLDARVYTDRFALTFKMNMVADVNAVLMNEDVLVTVKNPLIAEDVSMVQNEQPVNIGIHVVMNNTIGELQINNVTNTEILNINLFNNVGQLVNSWNTNLNKRDISLPVHTATGIYNVQITTKNGTTVKKIMVE
ncbi:MAG: T9SS type A sorting domain-containing protein [Gelidibacter sp.]|nr:T9SS type A sorting domain-containing protein [Gelidibacter sp.]